MVQTPRFDRLQMDTTQIAAAIEVLNYVLDRGVKTELAQLSLFTTAGIFSLSVAIAALEVAPTLPNAGTPLLDMIMVSELYSKLSMLVHLN